MASESMASRFYEEKYPEIDELVMVLVKRIETMGVYVQLLEYNNAEGMILLSELSKRRIRSVAKLIRVGRMEVVSVLRVDREQGYIDLSKKRVGQEDAKALEEKYHKSKLVHSIMRHVASHTETPLPELCEKIAWPLYKKYPHALDGLRRSVAEPEMLESLGLSQELKDALMAGVRRRLTPQMLRVRARIEVKCDEYEGVEAVKRALMAGIACSTAEHKVVIRLIAPPAYSIMVSEMEKDAGLALVQEAIDAVKVQIAKEGGGFAVKLAPEICGDLDEFETEKDKEKDSDDSDSDSDGSSEEAQDESMGFGLTEEDILKQTGGDKK